MKKNDCICGYAIVAAIFLSIFTLLVYLPVLQNGFVNLDDGGYVYDNLRIRSLDLQLLSFAFSSKANEIWHPLTIISVALDYAVWKLDPMGYHLTNVILHAINSALVLLLMVHLLKYWRDKKKALAAAVITGVLFSIHPMRVESVAWISERKDVLYSFFFLLSILMYAKYADTNKKPYYFYSLFFFTFSLLSKPMAVMLPVIVVMLDFYPYNMTEKRQFKRVMIEKVPYFLLSSIVTVITILFHSSWGSSIKFGRFSLQERIYDSVQATILYIAKMVFPINLAHYYPPTSEVSIYRFAVYLAAFCMIMAVCILSLKKHKAVSALVFYYIVTLLPVSGLIKTGSHSMADRYVYLPGLGFCILIGLGFPLFIDSLDKRWMKAAGFATLIAAIMLLVIRTEGQVSVWKDSASLWKHELRVYPDNKAVSYFLPYNVFSAYIEKGDYYLSSGKNRSAIDFFSYAIDSNKSNPLGHYKRGVAYINIGVYDLALKDLDNALNLYPLTEAFYKRGICHFNLGNYKMAVVDLDKELNNNPRNIFAYYYKGLAYLRLGDDKNALISLDKVIEIEPKFKDANELRDRLLKGQDKAESILKKGKRIE